MQANLAIGLVELSSIAKGVETLDAMRKMSEIKIEGAFIIPRGKYVIFISGTVADVESSVSRGVEIAGKDLIDKFIIRNVHKGVLDAFNKRLKINKIEAVGMIETKDAVSSVFACDAALKAAFVEIVELRVATGGGKGYFVINGEVGAVRTAIASGLKAVGESAIVNKIVIPNAHPDLIDVLVK